MDLEDETKVKWFCPEPFAAITTDTTGLYKPCCATVGLDGYSCSVSTHTPVEAMNSPAAKKLRKAFIDDDKEILEQTCKTCMTQEENGIRSHRQYYNDRYTKSNKDEPPEFSTHVYDLVELVENVRKDPEADIDPKYFHTMEHTAGGGNYCNLKCAMCTASSSSSFAKESFELDELYAKVHKHRFGRHKYVPQVANRTDKEIKERVLPNLKEIKLTGGEPLAIPYNYDLLKHSVYSGYSENQTLRIITNGTMTPKHHGIDIFDIIPRFNKVIINVSIEAWGVRNNYIRYPSEWNTVLKNAISLSRFENCDVTFVSTINALNIGYLNEIIQYNPDSLLKPVAVSYVVDGHPTGMNISAIPDDIKEQYIDKIYSLPIEVSKMLQPHVEMLESKTHNQVEQNILLTRMAGRDRLRGTNLLELWPEWTPYYEDFLRTDR